MICGTMLSLTWRRRHRRSQLELTRLRPSIDSMAKMELVELVGWGGDSKPKMKENSASLAPSSMTFLIRGDRSMKCKIMMAMMRLGPVRPPLPVRSPRLGYGLPTHVGMRAPSIALMASI